MNGPVRRVVLAALVLICLAPAAALPVQEWYDFYLQARDQDIPAERWKKCEENLPEALRLRPRAAVNVQTYGLQFVRLPAPLLPGPVPAPSGDATPRRSRPSPARRGPGRSAQRVPLATSAAPSRGPQRRGGAADPAGAGGGRAAAQGRRGARAQALLGRGPGPPRPGRGPGPRARHRHPRGHHPASRSACSRPSGTSATNAPAPSGSGSASPTATASLEEGKPDRGHGGLRRGPRARLRRTPGPSRDAAPPRSASRPRAPGPSSSRRCDGVARSSTRVATRRPSSPSPRPPPGCPRPTRSWPAPGRSSRACAASGSCREQIEGLAAQGEEHMKAGRFPEAQVAFENLLLLDPGHARARERLAEAERRTGEELLARWFPNREPTLVLFEPAGPARQVPHLRPRGRGHRRPGHREGGVPGRRETARHPRA